jgi:predicted NACHT family NTPase
MDNEALREELANYAHEAWSGWMKYLFSKTTRNWDDSVTISAEFVDRWERQLGTSYPLLPENEQQSDKDEADKILKIMSAYCE